ncbi:hypothetical protein NITGR_290057 [Nitrospina gracilis 3/211]|uniref:Lipoprotein n=1 Tax=Nitrospina gracilis (strain 3/211) TaxID=1266370 RepID=M1YIY0_NITG3|nr:MULTISPECIES: hypothetical protein [Nitrospina]MCF8723398.1 hypothetical protein [Nitrospina sp. Nb-3]CCQ90458.1 hypothetical protein NITGR_290057 [Nitrospina gracilis 3/211]
MNKENLFQLILFVGILVVSGCEEKFILVTGQEFKERLEESKVHSAVSYWYLGDKGEFHFFVEKWPTRQEGFKVSQEQVDLLIRHQPLKEEPEGWVNLKASHVKFKF